MDLHEKKKIYRRVEYCRENRGRLKKHNFGHTSHGRSPTVVLFIHADAATVRVPVKKTHQEIAYSRFMFFFDRKGAV